MLQNIFIFIAILVAAAFQVSFLPNIFSPERAPDFLLILIVFFSTRRDFFQIFIWIILAGMALDVAYFAPIGLNIFSFIFIAFTSKFLARRLLVTQETWKFLIMLGFIILGTFLNDWIMLGFEKILFMKNFSYEWRLFLNKDIFIKTLYNLIVFTLIHWPLIKIDKYLELHSSRMKIFK